MSSQSREQAEAQARFQEAIKSNIFTKEELKAMRLEVSRFENDYVIDKMLEKTKQKSLKNL
jgi:hypothetical protein